MDQNRLNAGANLYYFLFKANILCLFMKNIYTIYNTYSSSISPFLIYFVFIINRSEKILLSQRCLRKKIVSL
jgi:hypothetical protein